MDPNETRQLSERMDALSSAIASLVRRMQALENQIAALGGSQAAQQQQFYTPPVPEYQAPVPPPVEYQSYVQSADVPPQFQFSPESAQPYYPVAPAAPPDRVESQNLESKVGLAWANYVGVVTLIIGVIFFFKYAIDNAWIGETGRVVLGVVTGLATIFGGDLLWNRGQKTFAQGIAALGVSILYLSFYASFGFYHLVPVQAAFALMVLTTVNSTETPNSLIASAVASIQRYSSWINMIFSARAAASSALKREPS